MSPVRVPTQPFTDTPASKRFDTWLLGVIVASLVMFDNIASTENGTARLAGLDWFSPAILAIE